MIVKLSKVLFIGTKSHIAEFFMRAQEEGFIEFLGKNQKKMGDIPDPVRRLIDAIKILRKQPVKEADVVRGGLKLAGQLAGQILELRQEIEKLSEEARFLESEIARVRPFGYFSFDDIAFIEKASNKKIQFYCVKTTKTHQIIDVPSLIYVGTEYDLDYFIGIHDVQRSYPGVIEMHFDRTAEELKNHLSFVLETLQLVEAELKGCAGHIHFLRDALLGELDIHALQKVEKQADEWVEGSLFTIEGWVPCNKIEKLAHLSAGIPMTFEVVAPDAEDRVPTHLENRGANQLGEELVRMYDIPAATDKDPSGWVIWAFTLFFAMIVADGGYGILYLGLAFFLQYKMPNLHSVKKRLLRILFLLSSASIIWGFATSSFFGIEIQPGGFFSRFSLIEHLVNKKAEFHLGKRDDVYADWSSQYPQVTRSMTGKEMIAQAVRQEGSKKTYEMYDQFSSNILLEISLLVGVIHILFSLMRYAGRNLANLGWIAFVIGGYLYFPLTLKATSMIEFLGWMPKDIAGSVGIQLLYGGLALAIVLAIIQKGLKGITEGLQAIQIFADILSYLRLYALALASAIMARTFNEMGIKVGLVVGWVIILLGHAVNLSLGTMGGVIHSLRLNFMEWYHYSFEGGGKIFNPLRKLRTNSNNREE